MNKILAVLITLLLLTACTSVDLSKGTPKTEKIIENATIENKTSIVDQIKETITPDVNYETPAGTVKRITEETEVEDFEDLI